MQRTDPVLHTVPFDNLRPTQMTIGLREVEQRRRAWRAAKGKARDKLLREHVAPGVRGPKGRFYIVDHHHLVRALFDEGAPGVFVQALADYSALDATMFWTVLDQRGWAHSYDARGRRVGLDEMPKHVKDLADDPYRSLAGEVRVQGGFAKDTMPFAEFLWASHFRNRIKRALIEEAFDEALAQALVLARAAEADYLPGWCGARGQARP